MTASADRVNLELRTAFAKVENYVIRGSAKLNQRHGGKPSPRDSAIEVAQIRAKRRAAERAHRPMRERAAQELSPEMGCIRRRRSGEGFSAGPLSGVDLLLGVLAPEQPRPAGLEGLLHVHVSAGQLASALQGLGVEAVRLEQALAHAHGREAVDRFLELPVGGGVLA